MTSVLYRSPAHDYPVAGSAQGMYILDAAGKQYLDMSGGAAVSCLGHGHPRVVEVVQEQLARLSYVHSAFFTTEPQEKLAQRLARRFGDSEALVYFGSGGSEVNETALKMCWQYWVARGKPDKKVVISREHSYHGNTFGVLSVSGNAGRRRASGAPLLDWPRISPCYSYRHRAADETMERYAVRVADELETAIQQTGADRVAAFICEPVVGSSLGVVAAEPGYLKRIRDICDRHDILMIADEVMCGSGRTGTYFACEHDAVQPDIATLGKGIGGGYQPLAAAVIGAKVARTLHDAGFTHGHTYIGHASACAAGCAVQDVMDEEGLLERTREEGEKFGALLSDRFGQHPLVGDIRGRGMFRGLEIVEDRENKTPFSPDRQIAAKLKKSAMKNGLICYPMSGTIDGQRGDHVLLAPPFIITESQIGELIDKLTKSFDEVL